MVFLFARCSHSMAWLTKTGSSFVVYCLSRGLTPGLHSCHCNFRSWCFFFGGGLGGGDLITYAALQGGWVHNRAPENINIVQYTTLPTSGCNKYVILIHLSTIVMFSCSWCVLYPTRITMMPFCQYLLLTFHFVDDATAGGPTMQKTNWPVAENKTDILHEATTYMNIALKKGKNKKNRWAWRARRLDLREDNARIARVWAVNSTDGRQVRVARHLLLSCWGVHADPVHYMLVKRDFLLRFRARFTPSSAVHRFCEQHELKLSQ